MNVAERNAPERENGDQPQNGTPARASLLLADDDRLILATLGEGLRDAGYDVHAVETGQAAMDLAAGQPFDLVILDVRMPDLSGIDVARALRQQGAPPVIFLSAYDDEASVRQANQEGALCYLVKPLNVSQLVPVIETALERSRELGELRDKELQLSSALDSNRDISVAVGLFMERRNLTREKAFELLRGYARSQRRRVVDIARELIEASDRINNIHPRS